MSIETWDPSWSPSDVTFSEGNLLATRYGGQPASRVRATQPVSAGKYYYEIKLRNGYSYSFPGVLSIGAWNTGDANLAGWVAVHDGRLLSSISGNPNINIGSLKVNQVIMCALDLTVPGSGKLWIGKNGVWPVDGDPALGLNPAWSDLPASVYAGGSVYGSGMEARFNAEQCSYPLPQGFAYYGEEQQFFRVSGAVTVDGEPRSRTVEMFRVDLDPPMHVASAESDAVTGAYSIDFANERFPVIGLARVLYGDPWSAGTLIALDQRGWPADAPNGHWYTAEVAGTTGSTEPEWPTDGSIVTDGTVTWRDMGLMEAPWAAGPYLPVQVI